MLVSDCVPHKHALVLFVIHLTCVWWCMLTGFSSRTSGPLQRHSVGQALDV